MNEKFKIVEYQEAWANTRHYDQIFRTTLYVSLGFSFACIALFLNGETLNLRSYFALISALIVSVISSTVLLKINRFYRLAFDVIHSIEKEANQALSENATWSKISLGSADAEPIARNKITSKELGIIVLWLNIIFLGLALTGMI